MLHPHQALLCACHLHQGLATYPHRRPRKAMASEPPLQPDKKSLTLQSCGAVFPPHGPTGLGRPTEQHQSHQSCRADGPMTQMRAHRAGLGWKCPFLCSTNSECNARLFKNSKRCLFYASVKIMMRIEGEGESRINPIWFLPLHTKPQITRAVKFLPVQAAAPCLPCGTTQVWTLYHSLSQVVHSPGAPPYRGSCTPALSSGAVLVVDNRAEEPSGNFSFHCPATETASLTFLIQHHFIETGSGINGGEN